VYLKQENEQFRISNQALRVQNDVQKTIIDKQEAKLENKSKFPRWLGRIEGAIIGAAIGIVIAVSI